MMNRFFYYGLTIGGVAGGLDQLTKWGIVHYLQLPTGIPHRIAPFLDFRLIWNRGISYGLFDAAATPIFLIALSSIITALLIFMLRSADDARTAWGLGLIIGGAVGNIADRLFYGAVVDFISLHIGGYYWYIFNLADIAITIGVILLLATSLIKRKSK